MKLFTIIAVLLVAPTLYSQEIPFTFYTTQEDYKMLIDGTEITGNSAWDWTLKESVEMNFDFQLGDNFYNKLEILSNGIQFEGEPKSWMLVFHSIFGGGLLVDRGEEQSMSPIFVKEEFVGENRAFVIEWRNAGLRDTPSNSNFENSFINYQIWLIENINLIKVVFGPSLTFPENWDQGGPFTKLILDSNALGLYGPADSPSYSFEDCSIPCVNNITGSPSEGVVYNFAPQEIPNSIQPVTASPVIKVYPNPVTDNEIHIQFINPNEAEGVFELYNVEGQQIPIQYFPKKQRLLLANTSFRNGIYFLLFRNLKGEVVFREKIIKG